MAAPHWLRCLVGSVGARWFGRRSDSFPRRAGFRGLPDTRFAALPLFCPFPIFTMCHSEAMADIPLPSPPSRTQATNASVTKLLTVALRGSEPVRALRSVRMACGRMVGQERGAPRHGRRPEAPRRLPFLHVRPFSQAGRRSVAPARSARAAATAREPFDPPRPASSCLEAS